MSKRLKSWLSLRGILLYNERNMKNRSEPRAHMRELNMTEAVCLVAGAGIGGGQMGNSGNITISGGVVQAGSHLYAAGIGGGKGGNAEEITILGGTVTARGGSYGAGIGGGQDGNGGNVVISGGSVSAVAGSQAEDIGAGHGGSDSGSLIYKDAESFFTNNFVIFIIIGILAAAFIVILSLYLNLKKKRLVSKQED